MLSATQRPAADTLVEGLVEGALRHPSAVVFFPSNKEGIDILDLEDTSARRAASLLRQGIEPGTLIGFLASPGPEFLANLFGALRIGAVVCVLPTNTRVATYGSEVQRLSQFVRAAGVHHLLATESFGELAQRLCSVNPGVSTVGTDAGHARSALPPVSPGQRALVLFTAGRTGPPKAVARSHRDLMTGLRAFRGAIGLTSADTLVQWLPLSHPLALFGLLSQVLHGGTTYVFAPASYHNEPYEILRCIAEHRATITTGHNSSYERLCDVVASLPAYQLDLSRWRVALNAGEPVLARTLERFCRTFALAGVRKTTMHPMYYVTEAVLAVTVKLPDTAPDILSIDRSTLADSGKVRFNRADETRMRSYVSSGVPVNGIDFRIANEQGVDIGNGVLGEIQIRSSSVASGYHRDLRATMRSMAGGWFRTGDRGFLWRGQLFVTSEDGANGDDRSRSEAHRSARAARPSA